MPRPFQSPTTGEFQEVMTRMNAPAPAVIDAAEILALARDVLHIEADAVRGLTTSLDQTFVAAVAAILECKGRVVVSGIGKSGHIAHKIASTMASTGTHAFFVHPAEASHGDLGMIAPVDVVVVVSNSGESAELLAILPLLKRQGAKLIAITGNAASTIARQADIHLYAGVSREACPLGLAPTASTTAALAMGDALALSLLRARGFSVEDFARFHPGGILGRRLLVRVSDIMRTGNDVPQVQSSASMSEALLEMSRKGLGMTAIVGPEGRLLGIFTDGDLRRTIESDVDIRTAKVESVMKRNPHRIASDKLASEAVKYMEKFRINGLLVTDDNDRLVGAFNMHELFRAGVV